MPDGGEAEDEGEHGDGEARGGVLRHVDRLVGRQLAVGGAGLLHVVEGIHVLYLRQLGEVVERRRRGSGPFQGAAFPRVAIDVGQLLAVADRDEQLDQLAGDAAEDQHGAEERDHQVGLPQRVVVVVQATGHAHEAEDVERHEGHVEAHQPAPEGTLAPLLVEGEAERFREPEGEAGQVAEYRAADDGVVEVGDQEQAVVQQEVRARDGQQDAGHAADGEGHHEAQGPQDRRAEAQAALVDGEQPVEQLHPGGDRDQHGGHAEEAVDVTARTHGEEVVQPHGEAEEGDRGAGPDHRLVAEHALAGEGRGDLGEDTEGRQDQDVHLGMAPGPEEVDVHHGVAAELVGEEVHVQVAVERQQAQRSSEDRERGDDQDVGEGAGPGEDRHLHQLHARGTHLEHGDQEVDPREQRAHPGYL